MLEKGVINLKLPNFIESPKIDPDALKHVDFEALKHYRPDKDSLVYKKYIKPAKEREDKAKKEKRRKWWSEKGMELVALTLSVVAIAISIIALLAQLGLIAVLPQT